MSFKRSAIEANRGTDPEFARRVKDAAAKAFGNLTREEVDYLRSLVRMDIRKKERGIEKSAPFPGQDPADFRRFISGQRDSLAFAVTTHEHLKQIR